jgi:AhpD family alkylhydroperoxidase
MILISTKKQRLREINKLRGFHMADVRQILNDFVQGSDKLGIQMPDVTKRLINFTGAAMKDGALSLKQKELIAVSIGVYARCEYCIVYHVYTAMQVGATADEIMEAAGVSIAFGGGPSMAYTATLVQQSIDEFSKDIKQE